MPRPSRIDIDLDALAHNARLAASLAGSAHIMAAVKADAYGHGMVECSRVLETLVQGLAVAHVEEAVRLRDAGIEAPVLVLEGPFDGADVTEISHRQFSTVAHSEEQLALLTEHALSPACPVWLKVDTGMHRLGIPTPMVESALHQLSAIGTTHIVLMSHLAHAEDPEAVLTRHQLSRWEQVTGDRSLSTSLMNSAGLIGHLKGDSDWMRPGYMLYGGRPSNRFDSVPLAPVMHFRSALMAVREIAAGETVGYGGRWEAERTSRIATIPVGYGDGYPRTADNGTPVWVDGVLCPLVGRVSMDMLTVDITDHPHLHVGAPVELWGRNLSVDTVASHAHTIGYELLTRMPARTGRYWLTQPGTEVQE